MTCHICGDDPELRSVCSAFHDRIEAETAVPCAVCKRKTRLLDVGWHAFLCSDECEAAYTAEYKAEQQKQEEPE